MAVEKRIFSQALSFSRNLKRRMSSGSNAERRKREGVAASNNQKTSVGVISGKGSVQVEDHEVLQTAAGA